MAAMRSRWSAAGIAFLMLLVLGTACNVPLSLEFLATSTIPPEPTIPPTASPTPPPTQTPVPTPSAAEVLSGAGYLAFAGDWDSALREYEKVEARASDPEVIALARLGVAATHLEAGDFQIAIDELDDFISTYGEMARAGQAYFLRAMAHEAVDEFAAAAKDYESYLEARPGMLDSYAHERAGDVLLLAEDEGGAISHYRAALETPRLGEPLGVSLKLGRALMQAGEWSEAVGVFDGVIERAQDDSTRATANLLAGQALLAMGDQQAGYGRYLDSVDQYPRAYDTYVGLVDLVDAGIPVDDFQRGVVDYYAEAYGPALSALTRVLMHSPNPEAYYYRGLTLRALGDAESAIHDFAAFLGFYSDDPLRTAVWLEKAFTEWAYEEVYPAAVNTYLGFVSERPEDPRAAEALFEAGRTAERGDDLERAVEIWLRLPDEYPGSEYAYRALFQAGVAHYRLGEFPSARESFERSLSSATTTGDRAAAHLWIGKAYAAESRTEEATSAWETAASADPTGYYSERAQDLISGMAPFQSQGNFDLSFDVAAERERAEAWMRATFDIAGPEPLSGLSERLRNDPRMIRGIELWQLGLFEAARDEFEALRKDLQEDPEATYRLMHTFLDMGLYRSAILCSRQVLRLAGMDDAATMDAPIYFNRVRFGPYFSDIILPAAASQGFDGLFLISVVRQESLFEGFATSYAAARGLMQVIPSTGDEIAAQLGWPPDYTPEDLYRPYVSTRFGSYYLARQRERFNGDLFAALAAYNGGPSNAAAWLELAPEDPDLFLEVIRLPQTHLYVRVIFEVFKIYQSLYAG
jgi:soluble lytic murein transglycosylase